MNLLPRTRLRPGHAVLLLAGLLLMLLPGVLQARGEHSGRRGGMPEVLAHLDALRAEVGAMREEIGAVSARLDALQGTPLTAETRYCFESETSVAMDGALSVGTGHGLHLTRGADEFGNAARANHDTTATRTIEARQGSATRGRFVVCLSGGALPLDRPLTAQEAQLVQEMNDVAADLQGRLNDIVTATNTSPEVADAGVELLLDDVLGFQDPDGAIGNQQFGGIAPALPGPAAIRFQLGNPDDLLAQSSLVQDVCVWAGSVGGALNPGFAAAVDARCTDPRGTTLANSVDAVNNGVQVLHGMANALFDFSTGTMMPQLNSIKASVDAIDNKVDNVCDAVMC